LGGEAALWTERIDFTLLRCRLWPRAAALAVPGGGPWVAWECRGNEQLAPENGGPLQQEIRIGKHHS